MALRGRYLESMRDKLAQLEALRDTLKTQEANEALQRALRSLAHSLAGSGAIYGFQNVSDTAMALEDAIYPKMHGKDMILPRLEALCAACGAALESAAK